MFIYGFCNSIFWQGSYTYYMRKIKLQEYQIKFEPLYPEYKVYEEAFGTPDYSEFN